MLKLEVPVYLGLGFDSNSRYSILLKLKVDDRVIDTSKYCLDTNRATTGFLISSVELISDYYNIDILTNTGDYTKLHDLVRHGVLGKTGTYMYIDYEIKYSEQSINDYTITVFRDGDMVEEAIIEFAHDPDQVFKYRSFSNFTSMDILRQYPELEVNGELDYAKLLMKVRDSNE